MLDARSDSGAVTFRGALSRSDFLRSRSSHTSPHAVQRSDTKCGVSVATAVALPSHLGHCSTLRSDSDSRVTDAMAPRRLPHALPFGKIMDGRRSRSRLAVDGAGFLVGSQPQEDGMPQMAVGRPLDEPNLRGQLRLEPLHFTHLLGRDAPAPV
jgi:hypothetical protein